MRRYLTILFPLAALSAAGWSSLQAQGAPLEDSVYSVSIHRMMHFRVCLPASLPAGGQCPTILLFHGFSGNYRNWTDLTDVRRLALLDTVLVVTPDGVDSWYVNSFTDSSARYESAIVSDLLPFVLGKYPADRRNLGIGGLSMGGYGALTLGLRHPDIFRFIGELSGSLDIPFGMPDLEKNGRGGLRPALTRAFGADTAGWGAVSPERLACSIDTFRAPYIYMANGIQDEFRLRVGLHRAFADILRSRGIAYEYHETPGRHAWDYWAREIAPLLRRFRELSAKR